MPVTLRRSPPGENFIINGQFDYWQRGTTSTDGTAGYYTADRTRSDAVNGSRNMSQQAFTLGQTDVPGKPKFYFRYAATGAGAAGDLERWSRRLENVERFSDRIVTFSFWAKASAGTPDISTEFTQIFGTGGAPSAEVTTLGIQKHTLSTSWQRFIVTAVIPSISGKTLGTDGNDCFNINFWLSAGSTFNARTDTLGTQTVQVDFANLKLEFGSAATKYVLRSPEEELALCQRYFCKSYLLAVDPGTVTNVGRNLARKNSVSTAVTDINISFPMSMRVAPTVTLYSTAGATTGKIRNDTDTADIAATAYDMSEKKFDVQGDAAIDIDDQLSVQWTADAEL